jgi:hypothetical protein
MTRPSNPSDRPDLGFGATFDDFDAKDWKPNQARKTRPADASSATPATEAVGFRSREPAPVTPTTTRATRRRRTGRNAQFNLKAKPETIDAFCSVADGQGWGLGETLEHAVALLQREYGADPES